MLPNLIVIGAMKCATSSLHYYLGLHPEIQTSRKKELDFFIDERNWRKGRAWYESHFTSDAKVCGESSPNYTKYPWFKGVPRRIFSLIPEAKLIYILRDPIERILSEYVHIYSLGGDKRPIAEALSDFRNNWYVDNSKYYMQLEQYLIYYPMSSILIITAEELGKEPRNVLRRVFRFLGVDDSFHSPSFSTRRHQSRDKKVRNRLGCYFAKELAGRKLEEIFLPMLPIRVKKAYRSLSRSKVIEKPILDKNVRQNLMQELEDDLDKLRKLTGRTFRDWSFEHNQMQTLLTYQ